MPFQTNSGHDPANFDVSKVAASCKTTSFQFGSGSPKQLAHPSVWARLLISRPKTSVSSCDTVSESTKERTSQRMLWDPTSQYVLVQHDRSHHDIELRTYLSLIRHGRETIHHSLRLGLRTRSTSAQSSPVLISSSSKNMRERGRNVGDLGGRTKNTRCLDQFALK